jgi:ribonucleoside-diphosphate reductase alpha chain
MWMRVAMGLSLLEKDKEARAEEFYTAMSTLRFVPSTPTLFHAGTPHPQLSSCYLNTVEDDLEHIFKVYGDNAQLSKWAGGIGTDWSNIRGTGSLIKTAGIHSQGVIPFLKIANDVTVAINRSGRRRGATCTYLETWHYDIEDFIELRKNTGDERRRTHDMNTANWIPDLFMKRVREDGGWTLFSPDEVPELHHTYGRKFEELYAAYEAKADRGEIALFKRMKARDLWRKILSMLYETGHPWVTFKDPCNVRSPQDHTGVVHNSNLCTEITLNTSAEETAVCNLGSVNFATHMSETGFDQEKVGETIRTAMRMLDNVIDLNFYPTKEARASNLRHRPVGLGIMGFQDALYKLNIPFASDECVEFADRSMEIVSYYAILASTDLARERGTYESFKGSKWDRGMLPLDTIALLERERGEQIMVTRDARLDWNRVRDAIKQHGMRNSNTMAIAPTATIANISGVVPSIEPIYKNIYVKSNISGDFTVVNPYLVQDLKTASLWGPEMLGKLKYFDGKLSNIPEIPQSLKEKYKETFEIDMHALLKAAAHRGKWIDQSQSLNIFFRGSSGQELSELYLYAWELGLKTTYYLRTQAASQVEKSTVSTSEYGATHLRSKEPAKQAIAAQSSVPTASPLGTSIPAPSAASFAVSAYSGVRAERISNDAWEETPVSSQMSAPTAVKPKLHIAEDAVCEACE